ncbi:MAG: transcriptional regulator GcvA [Burkholderiales bacterium]|nr:transcriptional regulator GcvA [Burkholderiales bacterium]
MSIRLPPLNSLRAFEAAARHLSFKKAAEELHVTPAAISHQVKALEDYLGVQLFRRLTRALELTQAAQSLQPKLRAGFDSLAEAVSDLSEKGLAGPLTVGVAPAFAVKWLIPRLPGFAAAHPEIDLRISASLHLIDVLRHAAAAGNEPTQGADLTIRFGSGRYPGFRADKLCSTLVTPIYSPKLLRNDERLDRPQDLRGHTLLHDDTVYFDAEQPDWAVWLKEAGVAGIDTARGPHFSHSALAIEAAADGLGVALTLPKLAAAELGSGRLIAPFKLSLPSKFTYYLVREEAESERPRIAAFCDWLLEELRRDS